MTYGSTTEASALASPEVHLGEPSWRFFPYLVDYRCVASTLLCNLIDRRIDGKQVAMTEDKHVSRRISTIQTLVGRSAVGLQTEERSFNRLTPALIRQSQDFKDILGLDNGSAKLWAARTTTALEEANSHDAPSLAVETTGFLVSDLEPFLERLARQPTLYIADI
jgi:hypothetical protein